MFNQIFNQRGQVYIIFLVLFIVGAIIYLNFSEDKSLLKFISPSTQTLDRPYTPPIPSIPDVSPSTPGVIPQVTTPAPEQIAPVETPLIIQPPIDITPPVISNISHRGDVFLPDTKEVVISVSTDEPASCQYSANPETGRYNSMSWYDETKRFHVKTISNLINGNSYDFFVRCQDFNGNANTGHVLISFRVLP